MKSNNLKEIKKRITPFLQAHGVSKGGIFGSAVRDELSPGSDIDIAIEIKKNIGLLEFIALKQKLEEQLERPVDLVEYDAIKPALKKIYSTHK